LLLYPVTKCPISSRRKAKQFQDVPDLNRGPTAAKSQFAHPPVISKSEVKYPFLLEFELARITVNNTMPVQLIVGDGVRGLAVAGNMARALRGSTTPRHWAGQSGKHLQKLTGSCIGANRIDFERKEESDSS
jgi:hypothetical protein